MTDTDVQWRQPKSLASRLRPTQRGAMVVIGLIAFGLVILGGLYMAPKAYSPAAPAGLVAAAPSVRLRFVAYDLSRQRPLTDPMLPLIAKLNPDYILLQGVNEDDSVEIIQFFSMEASFHPQLYQRSEHLAGRKGTWGNLILGRRPLYEGGPLGGKRGGYGGWALAAVDDQKFRIADLHTAAGADGAAEADDFHREWREEGSLPLVAVALSSEAAPPAELAFLHPVAAPGGGEFFFISNDWQVLDTGTAEVSGEGLVPRWVDVEAVSDAPTTMPTTRSAPH